MKPHGTVKSEALGGTLNVPRSLPANPGSKVVETRWAQWLKIRSAKFRDPLTYAEPKITELRVEAVNESLQHIGARTAGSGCIRHIEQMSRSEQKRVTCRFGRLAISSA